ncbi:MAG: SHOCT domain-containing protein [Chloroflexi bacterium]|nr:SHOCT domain-containing protein [Chloroflexota bacterium]
MGPMGPMMGGWSGGSWGIAAVGMALAVVLVLILLATVLAGRQDGSTPLDARRPRSPAEILRERYARGELTRQQYQEALVDILKDHYVRGEIGLDEYQARLERLLENEHPGPGGERVLGDSAESRWVGARRATRTATRVAKGGRDENAGSPKLT